MSFDPFGLKRTSLEALARQQITTPTPIQQQAIPVMLEGRDIIGRAHTGSGKTLAFGLPLIEACDPSDRRVQALVLTPTRELARQVGDVLEGFARPAKLNLSVVFGGVGYEPQIKELTNGAQIVVGTPGRVLDHLGRGTLNLRDLRLLVLDEADEMLDKGFARDVERIIASTPRDRQTALFSATTPEWVKNIAARHLYEPEVVAIEKDAGDEPDIEHKIVEVWSGDKMPVLVGLLNEPLDGSTLVFGRTRRGVQNLARRLQRLGYEVEALQGDLSQNARDRIVKRFREGRVPILLATNVAARGLDMLNIARVINYDVPETSELFVHRVGRTARMGRSGEAITLISTIDLSKLREIERALGKKLPRISSSAIIQATAHLPAPAARPLPERRPVPVAATATSTTSPPRRRRPRGSRPAGGMHYQSSGAGS